MEVSAAAERAANGQQIAALTSRTSDLETKLAAMQTENAQLRRDSEERERSHRHQTSIQEYANLQLYERIQLLISFVNHQVTSGAIPLSAELAPLLNVQTLPPLPMLGDERAPATQPLTQEPVAAATTAKRRRRTASAE